MGAIPKFLYAGVASRRVTLVSEDRRTVVTNPDGLTLKAAVKDLHTDEGKGLQ